MINENQLLEQKELREKNLGRIEVLDQVKKLLLLGDTDFATMEMVAKYYDVPIETIKSTINYNREEIEANGYRIYTKDNLLSLKFNLKTKRGGFNVLDNQNNVIASGSNNGMALFSKRAILNVGMLLRDSDVAKEIRSRLLDIAHDSETESGNIKTIITEIDEERSLMLERVEAEMQGDYDTVSIINAKLFALKNKRIEELENINKSITIHSTTIENSRSVINRLIRSISVRTKKPFATIWNEFYSRINYKLNINIKGRDKDKCTSWLDTLNESEIYQAEIIARNWATRVGLDVNSILSLN